MNRNGLVLRQRTHIAQKLPKDVDDKVDKFHRFVIDERKLCTYAMSDIGNMDETPMYFDMPGNTTVDFSGNKTISIKTTGHEKQHFTVVLACLADGTKLKPMVIFKRKTMPKDKFPSGVLVKVQEKGWMNESLTHTWLDEIWFKRSGSLVKPTSLLVWDQFRAHLCESVKKKLHRNKTRQAVIPGGCTSILQPLDVSLNKPFKVQIRNLWNTWMVSGPKEFTKGGALKRPSLVTVIEWVKEAWNSVPCDMVIKSFKKCGISNAMDGTEDDILFDELICGPEQVPERDQVTDDGLQDYYDAGIELSDNAIDCLFQNDLRE